MKQFSKRFRDPVPLQYVSHHYVNLSIHLLSANYTKTPVTLKFVVFLDINSFFHQNICSTRLFVGSHSITVRCWLSWCTG